MARIDELLTAYDRWSEQVTDARQRARDALENGKFEEAQEILSVVTQSHARSSVSMRNQLIKGGFIKGEES